MAASPFTITTGSNTVLLNAERKGEAVFTVSNASGRPLRGRGVLRPLGQTDTGWLSIESEAERNFGIGATQQYTVQVAVPPSAAPGDYTFRLDAVDVTNPDENFTQGPVVTFQVAPLPPPPPKPFPWWIVAVAAGVLVLCVLAAVVVPPIIRPTPTPKADDIMEPGEVLNPSNSIRSANGQYTFVYQDDGNLVLYRNRDGVPLWASNTAGIKAGSCIMQGNGNLVVYDVSNNVAWASNTGQNPGSYLAVQSDGNVVIYRPGGVAIWATNTRQE